MRSTTKRMFNLKKNLEYVVAAVVALYIVFYTNPAPWYIQRLLGSSTVKVFVLAGVCMIGYKYSVLVSALLGLAFVLSLPSSNMREGLKNKDDEDSGDEESDTSIKEESKKDRTTEYKPSKEDEKDKKKVEKKDDTKKKEEHSEPIMKKSPRAMTDADTKDSDTKDPSPISSTNSLISSSESEKFSLMNASPF